MNKDSIQRIKKLVGMLNTYRDEYYNNSNSIISDPDYDRIFDELNRLEKETGFVLSNSPTKTVGYEVKSKLEKVTHNHPMLSLDKTKSVDDILSFLNGKEGVAMLKMDGLTCSCIYKGNSFGSAESRGNGEIGELIGHNVKTIKDFPLSIGLDSLIVDGEIIIDYDTFDAINNNLSEDEKYKNPRNLASGSARQLDSKIASQRGMRFIAWKVVEGIDGNDFFEKLETLYNLGFEVVPHYKLKKNITKEELESVIDQLKSYAEIENLPIDGIVFGFNDIKYGKSLGETGHHVRSQLAYKFFDEMEESVLRDVEWNTTRSGQINPTAIFDTVIIDGTEVSRASLFNLTFIKDMQLNLINRILVSKRNSIIPYVEENLDRQNGNYIPIPLTCSSCGAKTEIKNTGTAEFLFCTNEYCKAKLLDRFVHFVKRDCVNIEGLSEATLEKFIEKGWIESFNDIYNLIDYKNEIIKMEGFGEKSYKNLMAAIEKSKNIKLENFIYALGITGIGKTASKTIAKYCHGDFGTFVKIIEEEFDWTLLDDFGEVMANNLDNYFDKVDKDCNLINYTQMLYLSCHMNFIKEEKKESGLKDLSGLTFVVTGSVSTFKNRDELGDLILSLNGKLAGSVSKNTNYLINNDTTSTSGKNQKAKEIGVPIISEVQFNEMIGRA